MGRPKGFRFKLLNKMNDVHPTLIPLFNPPYSRGTQVSSSTSVSMNIKSLTINKTWIVNNLMTKYISKPNLGCA